MGRRRWLWRALIGGLILGLPAGVLFFIKVPVLTVTDVKAGRQLLAVQVRAGDHVVLSSRHSGTQGLVTGIFEVKGNGAFSIKETTFRSPAPALPEPRAGEHDQSEGGVIRQPGNGEPLQELSLFVSPSTEYTLVVKGKSLNLSREVRPASLVKIRVERRFWWRTWPERIRALLSRLSLFGGI